MRAGEMLRRIKLFVQRDRAARELEEEMRLHLEMRASRIGAEAAQRRFGNTTATLQRSRDAWGFIAMRDLVDDVRFAARRVLKQRGVAATVIAVMAVGIGATTAMFSAVDAALLRPLPFAKPDQLVMIPAQVPTQNSKPFGDQMSFIDVAEMHDLFSHVAAYAVGGLNLSGNDHPLRLKVGVVTSNFFATLGVRTAIGRTFGDNEGAPGGANVAILSDGLWKRQFGSRSISGLTLTLNAKVFDVIGVMPPSFAFPEQSDVWIPMTVPLTSASFEPFRDYVDQTTIGRLADNVEMASASARLLARIQSVRVLRTAMDSSRNTQWVARVRERGGLLLPFRKLLTFDRATALYVLLGATGLLLLIACANVTNLLLAQASVRRREIAVRQVLGATRSRILRQLLTESVLLSLAGAFVGTILALGAFEALQSLMPAQLLGVSQVQIDWRVLGFSVTLSLVSGVCFGLWPALGSARRDASESIKSGDGHGTTSGWSGRLRRTLVGAELALTVMLLIGAGIMLRSFDRVVNRDLGITTASVGTVELAFSGNVKSPERFQKLNQIARKMMELPGVVAVGVSKTLPLASAGDLLVGIDVPGVSRENIEAKGVLMNEEFASSGYFNALNIPLLEGRLFTAAEDADTSKSAIVSATTAQVYWPNVSPIGHTFSTSGDTLTVIGVVADVVNQFDGDKVAQVYHPLGGRAAIMATIVARSSIRSREVLQQLASAVRAVDAAQPVYNLRMMEDVHDQSISSRRSSTKFLTIFAFVALLLACVGVYAVVSYGLAQRQRELGIRSALGATGGNLLSLLSREMVWVAGIGTSLGLLGAWAAARVLESLAYGVDVHDPITFVLVPTMLFVASLFAMFVPARRVLRINPSDVMRAD